MHYYTFKPKDYMSKTAFLEPLEDLAYRRMLDHCYLTEKPLPKDIEEIAMLIRMRSHTDSIKTVLHYFFELTADGYVNDKVQREIANYHEKSSKARASANARWDKKANKNKSIGDDANALREDCDSNANQEPRTKNQELNNNTVLVFDFWKEVFSKSGRTIMKGKRESVIKARLKEGYTVDEIKKAILNVSTSDYHITNGHTDIELICRNQVNLDKYIALGGNPAVNQQEVAEQNDQKGVVRQMHKPKPKNYLDL